MGWQKWDYDNHAMVPMGKTFEEGGRTALEIMEPGKNQKPFQHIVTGCSKSWQAGEIPASAQLEVHYGILMVGVQQFPRWILAEKQTIF
jgi:hypothetical protein